MHQYLYKVPVILVFLNATLKFFKPLLYLFCLFVCMLCACCVDTLRGQKEDSEAQKQLWATHCGCWDLNSSPLREQQENLTAELSLPAHFSLWCFWLGLLRQNLIRTQADLELSSSSFLLPPGIFYILRTSPPTHDSSFSAYVLSRSLCLLLAIT